MNELTKLNESRLQTHITHTQTARTDLFTRSNKQEDRQIQLYKDQTTNKPNQQTND